ncbi:hypothetical protein NDU88_005859 [Pleurodeles waltl]|uniref:Uncharacterized protein n=1 Tax=Pleurodeles waltl TaxID=8319 RepID=A0AAV7VMG8_PLEWA|nr:hypothetical protein NDU88_005859 [Pleurodeles waltl]
MLKSDLRGDLKEQRRDVSDLGSRVEEVEKGLYEQVDSCEKLLRILLLEQYHKQLQDKCEDLENRSYWNNVCIPVILLEVQPPDLSAYIQDLFRDILEQLT